MSVCRIGGVRSTLNQTSTAPRQIEDGEDLEVGGEAEMIDEARGRHRRPNRLQATLPVM